MKRKVLIVFLLLICGTAVFAQSEEGSGMNAEAMKFIAAALAVGFSCIGSGLALGKVGAAAMGAMSENPDLSGKAMPYAGLAEGICLWGFLVALLLLFL